MSILIKKIFKKIFRVKTPPTEPLSTFGDPVLEEKLILLDNKTVKRAGFLDAINSKECHFRHNLIRARKEVIVPVMIGFMLGFGFFINDFVQGWRANERALLRYVSDAKILYGEQIFLSYGLSEDLESLKIISDEKEVSLPKYLYMRYSKDGYYGEERARRYLIIDASFGLFFLSANILIISIFLRLRKPANFIIDHERQLFYTWKKGKVYVSRYKELGVAFANNILHFKCYGLNEKNELTYQFFIPYLSLFNSDEDKVYILAFMSKYLLQGKEAVSSVDFKRQDQLPWFRKQIKPADLETQITAILAELDRLWPPKGATDPK
ncbi:hypothetical protein KKJ09_10045 [Xenorhabdus bovienii]|uniref:hypothetical protein n=1 Tax=Xenorhabdus bovienii TaxID=40576 RepID=UPI0023B32E74|nr:hypothetical protein [Xenorhabdus bovienii]MDE9493924.1 hypothetical protein [Xenorhabdus bovienii]MDE9502460.1 hypothetical protein [Xenorhabdus bovienii]MDE9524933.1 hypothetical protein [Xenorhabdus bovienii]MDE9567643.1 hypothetical protein [Xenorhabdus bovienii]